MVNKYQKPLHFDSEKVDRLVDLVVEEVMRNQNLFLRYLNHHRVFLDEDLPKLLEESNQKHMVISPEDIEVEQNSFFFKWAKATFQDKMNKRVKQESD